MVSMFDHSQLRWQVAATQVQKALAEGPDPVTLTLDQAYRAARAGALQGADEELFSSDGPAVGFEVGDDIHWIYLGDVPSQEQIEDRLKLLYLTAGTDTPDCVHQRNLTQALQIHYDHAYRLAVISSHLRTLADSDDWDEYSLWAEWRWFCRWCEASQTSITDVNAYQHYQRGDLGIFDTVDDALGVLSDKYAAAYPNAAPLPDPITPGVWESLRQKRLIVALPEGDEWRFWWNSDRMRYSVRHLTAA